MQSYDHRIIMQVRISSVAISVQGRTEIGCYPLSGENRFIIRIRVLPMLFFNRHALSCHVVSCHGSCHVMSVSKSCKIHRREGCFFWRLMVAPGRPLVVRKSNPTMHFAWFWIQLEKLAHVIRVNRFQRCRGSLRGVLLSPWNPIFHYNVCQF